MAVRLKKYSFRFSEELFNSRLAQKSEIEQILYTACVDLSKLNRRTLFQHENKIVRMASYKSLIHYNNKNKENK